MPSLPSARNTTYTADDQVKSADLNAIQDEIVDLADGEWDTPQEFTNGVTVSGEDLVLESGAKILHGDRYFPISPYGGSHENSNNRWQIPGPGVGNGYVYPGVSDPGRYMKPIEGPLKVGDRLQAIVIKARRDDAETITFKILKSDLVGGAETVLATVTSALGAAANVQLNLIIVGGEVIDDESSYNLEVTATGITGDLRFYGGIGLFDRPADA